MAVNFEQFYKAIAEQESSNNYKAKGPWVGGDRAYGKYQIMGANLASWGRKFVGHAVSADEFLNNPDIQEKMARGQLKEYWDKYGGRGAAAAWYSGDASLQNSTRPQAGGMPSIKEYVDSVMSTAATKSGEGGGDSTGGDQVTPQLNPDELAERYGWASSFLNSVPELKSLFGQAVSSGWTKDMFTAKLRDTNWFRSMSADERKWAAEWETDPATAHAKLAAAKIKARQYAAKLGMVENAELDKRIEEAAMGLVSKGWDESQMRYFLGQYVYFGDNQREGEGGEAFDELRKYAYNMGVELNGEWYAERARNIVRGIATIQDNKNEILKLARAQFPQWIPQLDGGQSVADIAQPYLQTMATILELPAGSVNLFDNTIKTALNYTNPSTLEKSAKPLWQFENELRSDPRWKQTKNAQDSMFQVGHKILADFGLKY